VAYHPTWLTFPDNSADVYVIVCRHSGIDYVMYDGDRVEAFWNQATAEDRANELRVARPFSEFSVACLAVSIPEREDQ
jgi:hypothetical protein